jgi:molybdopterin biosynthesis enzyme
MITLKHGEVALVQVPAAWLPKRVNQEQRRINRTLEKQGIEAKIVVVSGGAGDGSPLDIFEPALREPEFADA